MIASNSGKYILKLDYNMKHLKRFKEAKKADYKELDRLCKDYLAYLIDMGFEVKVIEMGKNAAISIDNSEFETYPYFDSFRYMNGNKLFMKTVDGEYYDLATTNGTRYKKIREGRNVRSI